MNNLVQDQDFLYGVVEDISDPLGLHRVRVRIIGVHNDNRKLLPTSQLPWALVANPTTSSSTATGTKHSLKSGSFVICKFLDPNDCQQPIVLFSLYSKIKQSGILYNSIQDLESPGAVFLNSTANNIPNQTTIDQKIPDEVKAKSQTSPNIANPLAQNQNVPIANGKNGGVGMFADIEREVVSLANIFKYVELYDVDNIQLTEDIDQSIGFIPINRTTGIPTKGIVQVGDEIITYNALADTGLSGTILRGSPDRGSLVPTKSSPHKKGDTVTWIYPIVKNDKSPLFFSKITKQAIDFKKEIEKRVKVISGYVTWLLSTISGKMTQLLSDLILNITKFLKSPAALVGTVIVNALLKILSQILCLFGVDTVDSIMTIITKILTDGVNLLISEFYKAGDYIQNFISSCSNKIFDAIMQFTSIVQSIGNLITNITNLFPGIMSGANKFIKSNTDGGYKFSLEDITKASSIVFTLLGLLGIGCVTNVGENVSAYSDNQGTGCIVNAYNSGSIECSPNPDLISQLNSLWRPLPQFITTYNFGSGLSVEYDTTPGTERTLISSPSGTHTEVFNDGTSKTVITKDNYTLILNDDYVEIKGNCAWKVDGDLAIKVSGNLDLEVGKQLRASIGGASQITYAGSHTTNHFGDTNINSANKYLITATQIGLASSGSVDINTGVCSISSSECNLTSTGSLSLMSLYNNTITGASYTQIHNGVSNSLVVGAENRTNMGAVDAKILGTNSISVSGINTLNNLGLYNINNGMKIEKTTGLDQSDSNIKIINSNMKLDTIAGASFNYAEGISLRNTQGINMDT